MFNLKKISALLIFSFALIILSASSSFALYSGGDGTETDPYLISTSADMEALRVNTNAGEYETGLYYELKNDINLTGETDWIAIGSNSYPFTGHFDGKNYKIALNIDGTNNNDDKNIFSLFGVISSDGEYAIKSLDVEGKLFCSEADNNNISAGGIAYYLISGVITDCSFSGEISGQNGIYGGIVSKMSGGTVSNCTVEADIFSNTGYLGGIVGSADAGIIKNCEILQDSLLSGDVDDSGAGKIVSVIGGIAGFSENSEVTLTVRDCIFNGQIIGSSAGGIVGNMLRCIVEYNTVGNSADISAGITAGGIGAKTGGEFNNNFVDKDALIKVINLDISNVSTDAGGIIGEFLGGSVKNNTSHAQISGANDTIIGGIIGKIPASTYDSATLSGNVYTGAVHGIGYNENNKTYNDTGCSVFAIITNSKLPSGWVIPATYYYCKFETNSSANIIWSVVSDDILSDDILSNDATISNDASLDVKQSDDNTVPVTENKNSQIYENTLPDGLSLDVNTGILSGFPTKTGEYHFKILASYGSALVSKDFTLTIYYYSRGDETSSRGVAIEVVPTSLEIQTASLANAIVGQEYSAQLKSNLDDYSNISVKWEKISGDLPEKLSLDESTGIISGLPITLGTSDFTIRASSTGYDSVTKDFRINVVTSTPSGGSEKNFSVDLGVVSVSGSCNFGFSSLFILGLFALLRKK